MTILRMVGVLASALCLACAQSAPGPRTPAFEVASIKPAPPPTDGRLMVRMGNDAGRINFSNVSLMNVITAAYKVKEHQVTGPAWLNSERFDITAKIPAGAGKDDVPGMLQALLADRFKLKLHTESKVMQSYALTVAKGGAKMKPAEGQGRLMMMMGPKGRHMSGTGTMEVLADRLSQAMDRPVVDMTELKGNFEIDLEFSGDEMPRMMRGMAPGGGGGGEARPHDESADAPSIFSALQNTLGLKLDPRKAPADVLIVDNIEKVPTDN
jgi:uncharacterized protein (TIGR03435 family)